MARGTHGQSVGGEFLEHSNEEREHADQLAARTVVNPTSRPIT